MSLTSAFLRQFRNLLSDKSGNFGPIAALVAIPLFGVAGLGVDYTVTIQAKWKIQNALDAAVLYGISKSSDLTQQQVLANEMFYANLVDYADNIDSVDFTHSDGDSTILRGQAVARFDTTFLQIVGKENIDVVVSSAAIRGAQTGHPLCIMAMHPTRKHTLELKATVSVLGPDCHIYGNSNHPDDVVDPHTPHNYITAASVQAVGYGHHYIQNVTPPLKRVAEVILDPFLSMSIPQAGSCTYNDLEIEAETRTLAPGTYCGGLVVKDDAKVTLAPGTHILSGGKLVVEEAQLLGEGVTLVFADDDVEMEIEGALVRLSAPVTGPHTSFVLKAVRQPTQHSFEDSTIDLYGIIYMPNGAIDWVNDGTPVITAQWAAWITDGFSWKGNGVINFPYNTKNPKVPHPDSLNVIPQPNIVDVVRLLN